MFIDTHGKRRPLQAGDSICWFSENHYIWFQDDKGNILRPDEASGGYKVDLSCLRNLIDFGTVADIIAMASGLKAVVQGEQSFRFQFVGR